MKKIKHLSLILLALTLSLGVVTGCSSNTPNENEQSADVTLNEGVTLEDIVTQIEEEIGVQMPGPIDDTLLNDMFHVAPDSVESYYGVFGMSMTTADNVVAIEAAPGQVEEVVASLEKRKEDVVTSFEQYLPDQYEKAQAGKVIQKGNYVFLVIAGDYEKGFDNEMAKAEEIINNAFN